MRAKEREYYALDKIREASRPNGREVQRPGVDEGSTKTWRRKYQDRK